MSTAVEPTPPLAPVTSTGPESARQTGGLERHHAARGGVAGGADRHRLARAQPVGQRHDPLRRHPRVLRVAAVMGDAEVVAVGEHLLAGVLVGPGQVDPGDQRRDPRHLALRDRRQRVLVVHARPGDLDEHVALARVTDLEVVAQAARDPVVVLLRHERPHTRARSWATACSALRSALVSTDEAGADGQQRDLGAALGPRHVLEPEQAREQVQLLGDDVDVDPGLRRRPRGRWTG